MTKYLFKDFCLGYTYETSKGKSTKTLRQIKGRTIFPTYEQAIDYVKKHPSPDFKKPKDRINKWDCIAGRLTPGTVLFDCDTESSVKAMDKLIAHLNLKPLAIKTTRGVHYYFRYKESQNLEFISNNYADRSHCLNVYGIEYDCKFGTEKKDNCGILYQKFTERKILSNHNINDWNKVDIATIGYAPDELFTSLKLKKTELIPFHDMKIGQRNSELFSHWKFAYCKARYSKEEAIKFIKTAQAADILPGDDPISDDELNTIMRDYGEVKQQISQGYLVGNTFLYNKLAEDFIEKTNCCILEDTLSVYHNNCYTFDPQIIRGTIRHMDSENIRKNRVNEIVDMIQTEYVAHDKIPIKKDEKNWISFKNCIVNFKTFETSELTPEIPTLNTVPVNYNQDALNNKEYADIIGKFFLDLANGDEELATLLIEIIGLCLWRGTIRLNTGQGFFLVGGRKYGKSTYLKVIGDLISEKNYSSVSLEGLNNRFEPVELLGKTANLGDDINDAYISDTAMLKKVITGDKIYAERKGEQGFKFTPYATQIFTANEVPRIKDPEGAVISRIVYVPFEHDFSKDGDPEILDKILSDTGKEIIAVMAITALHDVIERKGVTMPECCVKLTQQHDAANNSIRAYIEDCKLDANYFVLKQPATCYEDYTKWCMQTGSTILSQTRFGSYIKKKFGLEIKNPTMEYVDEFGNTQKTRKWVYQLGE